MFHGNQDNGIGLRLAQLLLDVADGVGVVGDPVGETVFEVVRRDDDHACVDVAVLEVVADVDDVPRQQIASPGDLDLDPHAGDDGLVVTQPFDPVDIAGLGCDPVGVARECGIDQLPDVPGAIGLLGVEDADLSANEDFLQLKKDVCQSETTDLLPRSAIELHPADLHW